MLATNSFGLELEKIQAKHISFLGLRVCARDFHGQFVFARAEFVSSQREGSGRHDIRIVEIDRSAELGITRCLVCRAALTPTLSRTPGEGELSACLLLTTTCGYDAR